MWGKDKQKRYPSYLEWRLMCCWDYVALLRFPFLRGPSSTRQKHALREQGCLFSYAIVPYKSKLLTVR